MSDVKASMPVVLIAWRPLVKGTLVGFATIRFGALEIADVSVFSANGKRWAMLPAKPHIDRDGQVKRDNGKIVYTKILSWTDRGASDRFSEAVIASIEAGNPGATE